MSRQSEDRPLEGKECRRVVVNVWLVVDLMKRGGIIPEKTDTIYCDEVMVKFGGGDSTREGYAILTDSQIILAGRYNSRDIGRATGYQIYYNDYETKPYLASVDFIDYNRIESVEPKWKFTSKGIALKYRTKYVKTKSRVLYGPLFFKFDLPKKINAIDGVLDITVQSNPYHKESKKRHEATSKKLLELMGR
ncbi:MAG: hypothetical protein P1Q69_19700 [Candidatus Thorarchaeota archaeon]|nr:hypothetical protein [Candidatus Thorarchaeota archaeon]